MSEPVECPECDARMHGPSCTKCGWKPGTRTQATGQPAAPEFVPPWKRPGFKPSAPGDRCDEPGCTLTIREHIEAFKRFGERMLQRAVKL